ncbi:MAG TPA: polysaccharide deacetylase family protein [Bryobacteraceae bacterium]|nr:polysaccharide deacetylase family protein [Bryobacteraceae bacterium]
MILIYHVVSDESKYLYSISRGALEEHLRLSIASHNGSRATAQMEFTFDDGYVSQYLAGLPLLEQCGRRATFFITPEWTDNRAGYMGWAQLRELVRLGHKVESHGWSHKFLTECSAAELESELRRSRQTLEDGLGIPVEALAVPNGAWNRRVLAGCAAAGYRRVYTSDPFMRRVEENGLQVLGRVPVRRNMGSATLERLARQENARFSGVRLQHQLKRAVRATIGQRNYHRLWCWLARSDSQNGSGLYAENSTEKVIQPES